MYNNPACIVAASVIVAAPYPGKRVLVQNRWSTPIEYGNPHIRTSIVVAPRRNSQAWDPLSTGWRNCELSGSVSPEPLSDVRRPDPTSDGSVAMGRVRVDDLEVDGKEGPGTGEDGRTGRSSMSALKRVASGGGALMLDLREMDGLHSLGGGLQLSTCECRWGTTLDATKSGIAEPRLDLAPLYPTFLTAYKFELLARLSLSLIRSPFICSYMLKAISIARQTINTSLRPSISTHVSYIMSAPPARGGSRGGFRGRGGPRKPQQPRAAGSAIPQQFSGVASTTDSTPAPSGTVTPAVEGGSGVRFRDFEGLSEQVLKGIPFEFCTDASFPSSTEKVY